MPAKVFAVIDTNVVVSALFTRNPESATRRVLNLVLDGTITPLFNEEILSEYQEVLSRDKFPFKPENINAVILGIEHFGLNPGRKESKGKHLPDPKDVVFYEVALAKEESFLVTGNIKHFPKEPIVVTPSEFLRLIGKM